MKTIKCTAEDQKLCKKNGRWWEERTRKERSKTDVRVTFKAKNYFEILLSAHAWTLEAKTMYFASESQGQEVYDL